MTDGDLITILKSDGVVVVKDKPYLPCTKLIIERHDDMLNVSFRQGDKDVWIGEPVAMYNGDTLTITSDFLMKAGYS